MSQPPRPSVRRLGARSNLTLPAELEARIQRIAAAHARFFGVAGDSRSWISDMKRMLIEIGAKAMEEKLGLRAPESPATGGTPSGSSAPKAPRKTASHRHASAMQFAAP